MSASLIRAFREEDRAALGALGTSVVDWWHGNGLGTSLHLIAATDGGEVVGHLQVTDRSLPAPSRRSGQCHVSFAIAPAYRRRGIGSALYACAEQFAQERRARLLYASYSETPDAPAASFLRGRGFEPLERFLPSALDLAAFDPTRFNDAVRRVEAQGIRLRTYAQLGDSLRYRRSLYELEQAARASQPFREVGPYIPASFETWEREFAGWDPKAIFLAVAAPGDAWVGVVTGLEWYFTGVHPDWRGRGLATALKVRCLAEAKRRGMTLTETENHEDNAAMLAVNRKLGFVFGVPEVACIKRLREPGPTARR